MLMQSRIVIEKNKNEEDDKLIMREEEIESDEEEEVIPLKKIWSFVKNNTLVGKIFPKTRSVAEYSVGVDTTPNSTLNDFVSIILAIIDGEKVYNEQDKQLQRAHSQDEEIFIGNHSQQEQSWELTFEQVLLKFKYEDFKIDETESKDGTISYVNDENNDHWVNVEREYEWNEVKRIIAKNFNFNEKYVAKFKLVLPKKLRPTYKNIEEQQQETTTYKSDTQDILSFKNEQQKIHEELNLEEEEQPIDDYMDQLLDRKESEDKLEQTDGFTLIDEIEQSNIEVDENQEESPHNPISYENIFTPIAQDQPLTETKRQDPLENSWQYLSTSFLDLSLKEKEAEHQQEEESTGDDQNEEDDIEDINTDNKLSERQEEEEEKNKQEEPEESKIEDDGLQQKVNALYSMGFQQKELNEKLLRFYNGDVDKALGTLLTLSNKD